MLAITVRVGDFTLDIEMTDVPSAFRSEVILFITSEKKGKKKKSHMSGLKGCMMFFADKECLFSFCLLVAKTIRQSADASAPAAGLKFFFHGSGGRRESTYMQSPLFLLHAEKVPWHSL